METAKTTLMKKDDTFLFTKLCRNQYGLAFSIVNDKLYLPGIVNLDFVKVLYNLSPEIFSSVHLEKINDDEGILLILVKPLFKELGIVQRFLYFYVKRIQEGNRIVFESQTIQRERPDCVPANAELINIENFTNEFTFHSPHKMDIVNKITLDDAVVVPPFVDKVMKSLVVRIFKRVKEFIIHF
jgi:hypothetical protein